MPPPNKQPCVYPGGPTIRSYRLLKAAADLGTGMHSLELLAVNAGLTQESALTGLRMLKASLLIRTDKRGGIQLFALNSLGRERLRICIIWMTNKTMQEQSKHQHHHVD